MIFGVNFIRKKKIKKVNRFANYEIDSARVTPGRFPFRPGFPGALPIAPVFSSLVSLYENRRRTTTKKDVQMNWYLIGLSVSVIVVIIFMAWIDYKTTCRHFDRQRKKKTDLTRPPYQRDEWYGD